MSNIRENKTDTHSWSQNHILTDHNLTIKWHEHMERTAIGLAIISLEMLEV